MKRTSIFILHVLLCLVVSLVATTPANAAMPAAQQTQVIQTLEDTLFAVHYDQETPDTRLSRLEETVFGQAQSNLSVEARISKLQSALSPSSMGALSPLAKKPPTDAAAASNQPQSKTSGTQQAVKPTSTQATGSSQPVQQAAKPTPGETDYPTVSQMELKLFGKTFVQEDITQRLARLEKQVFKIQQNGALADRVDNLRLVVLGDTGTGADTAMTTTPNGYQVFSPAGSIPPQYAQLPSQGYPQQGRPQYTQIPGPGMTAPGYDSGAYPNATAYSPYGPGGMSAYQPSPYPNTGASGYNSNEQPVAYAPPSNMGSSGQITPDMLNAMNETEKEVLGHIYEQEPMNTRLDRLEGRIFNTTSPEMSTEDRLQRVIAVSSAGGAPQSPQARAKSTFQTLLPIILTILPMILL